MNNDTIWRSIQEQSDGAVLATLIAYALTRWRQANFAEAVFQPRMLARARSAIESVTGHQGRVGQCSGEAAGIGKYSTTFGNYLWAQAPAVAADLMRRGEVLVSDG